MNSHRVVKVKPYPISLLLFIKPGSPAVRSKILKVTEIGFIALIPERLFLAPGDTVRAEFDIPASHETVHADVQVVKLYNRIKDNGEKEHLSEMHFKGLDSHMLSCVRIFISKIGQNE